MSLVLATRLRTRGISRAALASAALVLVGLAVFGGAARNGFTSWDDDLYVLRNPAIVDPGVAGIARIFTTWAICNYHPLTILSFAAEHAAVGLAPWLYHLDNLLLHVTASVLAFLLARRWLRNDAAAAAAALLFLVHPLRVESVAWIAERKDVLCAVFYLGSLLAYTAHLERADARKVSPLYLATLGLFLCALLSKVMAVTLPGVIAIHLTASRRWSRERAIELAPLVALSAVFVWIGALAQSAEGAVQAYHGGGLLTHILTVPKALAFYAWKLLWPVRLSPRYTLEAATGFTDPWVLAGIVILGAGIAAAWASRSQRRVALLGLGFFAVAWAPVSGIVPLSTIVADRYVYLPSLGLSLVAGTFFCLDAAPSLRTPLRCAFLAIAVAFGCLSAARVDVWRDGETLWTDALEENPANPFAHNQLTLAYLDSYRYAEALSAAREAARLGLRRPEHLFNVCLAQRGLGDRDGELEAARRILATSPTFTPAWTVVLRQLVENGELDESDRVLEALLDAHPEDAGIVGAKARLEAARGKQELALVLYLRSIEMRPGDPESILGAAVALASLGDAARAVLAAEGVSEIPGARWTPGAIERIHELRVAVDRCEPSELQARARALEERASRR